MTLAVTILQVLVGLMIILMVLFQSGKNQGLGVISGAADTFLAKSKAKSLDAKLARATKWVGALFILLLMQYGGSFLYGTGEVIFKQQGGSTGALDFAFGYCYMMGGTTGVVTYLYRKHGNVLCGVIPASIFCGLFTLLSFTLVR